MQQEKIKISRVKIRCFHLHCSLSKTNLFLHWHPKVNSIPNPDQNKNVPKHSEGKPDLCTLFLVGSWAWGDGASHSSDIHLNPASIKGSNGQIGPLKSSEFKRIFHRKIITYNALFLNVPYLPNFNLHRREPPFLVLGGIR